MYIYIIFFSLLIIGGICYRKQNNRKFLIVISFLFFLIIGLRNIEMGADTAGYVDDFKTFSNWSWSQMSLYLQDDSEPLYTLYSWLLSFISKSYTLFLLGWAIFPSIALYKTLKRYTLTSRDVVISFLVFTILDICLKVGQALAFKQTSTYYIQRAVSITLYDGGIGQCFSRRTVY